MISSLIFVLNNIGLNSTSEYDDTISMLVRNTGNYLALLHYLSAYPMAYCLAPALTLLVKSETRAQNISPLTAKQQKNNGSF